MCHRYTRFLTWSTPLSVCLMQRPNDGVHGSETQKSFVSPINTLVSLIYKFYNIFSEVANYGKFILGNKSDKQKQKVTLLELNYNIFSKVGNYGQFIPGNKHGKVTPFEQCYTH